jgi:hypothetical protein
MAGQEEQRAFAARLHVPLEDLFSGGKPRSHGESREVAPSHRASIVAGAPGVGGPAVERHSTRERGRAAPRASSNQPAQREHHVTVDAVGHRMIDNREQSVGEQD